MLHVEGNFTISSLRKFPSIANVILLFLYFFVFSHVYRMIHDMEIQKRGRKTINLSVFRFGRNVYFRTKTIQMLQILNILYSAMWQVFFIIKMGICTIYFKADFIRFTFKTFGLKSYWIFWMYIIYFRCLLQTYWSIFGTSSKILMPNEPYHANQCSEYYSIQTQTRFLNKSV